MDANSQTVLIVAMIVIGVLIALFLLRDRIRSGGVRLEADKGILSVEMTADPANGKNATVVPTGAAPEKEGIKVDNNRIAKGGEQDISATEEVNLSASGNTIVGKQKIEIGKAASKGKKS